MSDRPPADAADLVRLDATAMGRLLAEGKLTAEELTRACLARIEAREPIVQAWTFLEPELALAQARARDAERRSGRPAGPLFGIPVGVKDIFDTADMPTECGTAVLAGRRPGRDSSVVARLRAAGAVVMGKTVTTEVAYFTPGKTRNPHAPGHTPGGSSSGSAASVADCMVPLAIGSQTNGSVIRPAAFCGTVGYKPSHGLISRDGGLLLSHDLDHVGIFARSLEDAARLGDCLIGHDPADPATRPQAAPGLARILEGEFPLAPELALIEEPSWPDAEPEMRAAMAELAELLDGRAGAAALPPGFERAHAAHQAIMATDMAYNFRGLVERGSSLLSPRLQELLAAGSEVRATDYLAAKGLARQLRTSLDPLFERFDAILTPSAPGPAPAGLERTGNPAFCTIWTLLGLPAISLPLFHAANGLPMGVQLIGQAGDDARLLRTARWLLARVAAKTGSPP